MEDVQSSPDPRGLLLEKAGVRGLRLPIVAFGQATVASVALSVSVPSTQRGAHMSRFLPVFERHREALDLPRLVTLLGELHEALEADRADLELSFPFFRSKAAPVSGETGLMAYDARIRGQWTRGGAPSLHLEAIVAVASLCPCSKAISDYGAHNQRGHVHVEVETKVKDGVPAPVTLDDLVAIAERHASTPLYPVLKRPDERHVTMLAYDRPAFVEDMARGVALDLREDPRVAAFRVRVVNQESIHDHDAFAELSWRAP
ncbi:MAG: GTP cyclohydrolase I FolE2 [Sandaracinus sp.]|nr:GTP cyclohydrolase I FolE2 [Sandaracinus sp.]MCB9633718.1 GTP cyclohydrolase I FolE2 [Sandaracinus sp.]